MIVSRRLTIPAFVRHKSHLLAPALYCDEPGEGRGRGRVILASTHQPPRHRYLPSLLLQEPEPCLELSKQLSIAPVT
jgi:hypothetical protein